MSDNRKPEKEKKKGEKKFGINLILESNGIYHLGFSLGN